LEVHEFLNTIQYAIVNFDKLRFSEEIEKWLEPRLNKHSYEEIAQSLWYDRSFKKLIRNLPEDLLDIISENIIENIKKGITFYKVTKNGNVRTLLFKIELKMLLYNWADDPIFYNKPEVRKLIIKEQKKALLKVETDVDLKETLRTFLIKSGIFKHISNSLIGI